MRTWKFAVTALWLGILAVADIRRMRVPVWLLAAGGTIVTLMSVLTWQEAEREIPDIFWGFLPGIVLILVAVTTKKAGWADGVVLLLLGFSEGSRACISGLMISLLAISVISLALLCVKKVGRNFKLPYLPFLWIGYLLQASMASGG